MDIGFLEKLKPRKRVLFGFLLGFLAPATILAAAYVFGGGPSLTSFEEFALVDSMLFASVTFTSAFVGGLTYWYFTRDISTSLAPVIGVFAGLYSGFEDYMVYLFCTLSSKGDCSGVSGLPGKWAWLKDSLYIGDIQSLLGLGTVTDFSVAAGILFAVFIGLFLVKTSDQIEFEILGLNV